MSKPAVEIVTLGEQAIWGIGRQSGDQTISADIHALSAAYHSLASVPRGSVLPFFVLSRNYDGRNGSFELFVGGALEKDGLEQAFLPPGEYAGMTVRPRLGFLWGAAIGAAGSLGIKEDGVLLPKMAPAEPIRGPEHGVRTPYGKKYSQPSFHGPLFCR